MQAPFNIVVSHGKLNFPTVQTLTASRCCSAPCLGYVFTETGPPNRRIVILGDTHDPSEIAPLCIDPAPSLLIHEATDAPIPSHVDKEGRISRRDPTEVQRKAILRGHSTPEMAGTFAKAINASSLVLNHIGGR